MSRFAQLPTQFPVGSKYILESRGSFVQRWVEFPNGRTVRLSRRKMLPCERWELQQISIAPHQQPTPVDATNERGSRIKERAD
jgi:hypothetical protein